MGRYVGRRYVRTEDKILDTELIMYGAEIISKYILKEADTIEELCDKFVIVDKERHIQVSDLDATNEKYLTGLNYVSNDYTVYGAIWTDKGLIYIAKMNNEGELELI